MVSRVVRGKGSGQDIRVCHVLELRVFRETHGEDGLVACQVGEPKKRGLLRRPAIDPAGGLVGPLSDRSGVPGERPVRAGWVSRPPDGGERSSAKMRALAGGSGSVDPVRRRLVVGSVVSCTPNRGHRGK